MSGGVGGIFDAYVKPVLAPWTGDRDVFRNILANTTPWSLVDSYQGQAQERATRIAGEEKVVADAAAAEQDQADKAAAAVRQAEKDKSDAAAAATAKAAADKIAADKAAEVKASEDAATLLANRRRTSSVIPSGARGILGQAPVKLKTLLGS